MLGNNLKPLTHQPIRHFVLSQQCHPQHLFLALLSWGFFCPQVNIHRCKEKKAVMSKLPHSSIPEGKLPCSSIPECKLSHSSIPDG